jgi:signal transduction histidine kinase
VNRLWIRFALVIIGILLAVIFLPVLLGPLLIPGDASGGDEMEAFFIAASLSAELQTQLQQRIIEAAQELFIRGLIVVGAGGAIAGIILSRMLSAPLQDLADGARAIAGRNLAHRVPVRGSDEMRTVAESFNDMAGQLEQAEGLRRQLLADVAHELRNPLHVLRGNLQAIVDGVYPLNHNEVSRLLDQTDHLTRLVNDLHELALAEARQLPLDRRPVDLGALTKEAVAVFQPLAAAQEIELRVELLGAPPTAAVDPGRIRQTIQNLLANALRHTPPGGRILVTVTERDGRAVLSVSDDGAGIAPEHLPQVFDRFFRTGDARDRESGGAGLGLAIVKAIVEAHDGEARAESAGLGRGSTFVVTLPTEP